MALVSNYLPDIITEELRALMLIKFCGYERVRVIIEIEYLQWAYRIRIDSLVTDMKCYLWFDADKVKNAKFRRLEYYRQLGLNWADPIC